MLKLTYTRGLMDNEDLKGLLPQFQGMDWVKCLYDRQAGTLKVEDLETGQLLFWGMQKGGNKDPWIVKYAKELFE